MFLTVLTVFSAFLSTGSIRSPRFLQKSDRKRIAHVTLYKKATISESIPLIFKKERQERFSIFHERITFSFFRSQKTSDSL